MKKDYRSFSSAKKFAQSLKLKRKSDWGKFAKSANKPEDIPSSVRSVYIKKWKGWGDFLGTGNIQTGSIDYRPFKEARNFAGKLNLKNIEKWKEFCKSGKKPSDIPTTPSVIYKKEWKGWGDFLGTGNIANQLKKFRSFEKARIFSHSLGLSGKNEWGKFCSSANKPADIPSNPSRTYQCQWKNWGDWLGTGNLHPKDRKFQTFTAARFFARNLNLKKQQDWRDFTKSSKRPKDIPTNPDHIYQKEWKNWADWLGTEYETFSKVREFARGLKLKSQKDWLTYCNTPDMPDDIPKNPNSVYKKEGWTTWGDFLGTGRVATNQMKFKNFKDARDFIRKLGLKSTQDWYAYCKSGKKPMDIPSSPWEVYAKTRGKKK